jgi:hypothetical protein
MIFAIRVMIERMAVRLVSRIVFGPMNLRMRVAMARTMNVIRAGK